MGEYVIEKLLAKNEKITWKGDDFVKTSSEIIQFLKEYEDLCRKHNISLSHEDGHGAFIFEEFDEDNVEWVSHAFDNRPSGYVF